VVLELVPRSARRILDLGAGDGRLLALLKIDRPTRAAWRPISRRRCSTRRARGSRATRR
jgi:hypothetical protein